MTFYRSPNGVVSVERKERNGSKCRKICKSGGRELREILYDGFSLFMCTIQEVSVYAHNKEMEEEGLMLIMEAEQLRDFRRVKKIWNSCGKRESNLSWKTW